LPLPLRLCWILLSAYTFSADSCNVALNIRIGRVSPLAPVGSTLTTEPTVLTDVQTFGDYCAAAARLIVGGQTSKSPRHDPFQITRSK